MLTLTDELITMCIQRKTLKMNSVRNKEHTNTTEHEWYRHGLEPSWMNNSKTPYRWFGGVSRPDVAMMPSAGAHFSCLIRLTTKATPCGDIMIYNSVHYYCSPWLFVRNEPRWQSRRVWLSFITFDISHLILKAFRDIVHSGLWALHFVAAVKRNNIMTKVGRN